MLIAEEIRPVSTTRRATGEDDHLQPRLAILARVIAEADDHLTERTLAERVGYEGERLLLAVREESQYTDDCRSRRDSLGHDSLLVRRELIEDSRPSPHWTLLQTGE